MLNHFEQCLKPFCLVERSNLNGVRRSNSIRTQLCKTFINVGKNLVYEAWFTKHTLGDSYTVDNILRGTTVLQNRQLYKNKNIYSRMEIHKNKGVIQQKGEKSIKSQTYIKEFSKFEWIWQHKINLCMYVCLFKSVSNSYAC